MSSPESASSTTFATKPEDAASLKASLTAAAGMYGWSNLEAQYAAAYSTGSALAAAASGVVASTNNSCLTDTSAMISAYNAAGGYVPPMLSSLSGVTRSFAHSTTPGTPKKKANPVPEHMKDGSYWDRRKKNNESARRSRESRRMKEEQVHLRVVYLENENIRLKTECQYLRTQIAELNMLVYGSVGIANRNN